MFTSMSNISYISINKNSDLKWVVLFSLLLPKTLSCKYTLVVVILNFCLESNQNKQYIIYKYYVDYVRGVFLFLVTFPCGALDLVWCLIVWISENLPSSLLCKNIILIVVCFCNK